MTTWIVLRAAGIGAYLMLFFSVAWGLASTTSVLGKRFSKASMTTVHQFTATCGLVLLGVHIGGLMLDTYTPFSIADITIPMSTTFRPVAVTLGIVAMYLTVFVIVTSWLRKPIGTKWWRRTHLLAVPTFVLSLLHGVFTGTDSVRPPVWWMYLVTGSIVLFLVVVRGLTAGFRPERAAHPGARVRTPAPAGNPEGPEGSPATAPAAGEPTRTPAARPRRRPAPVPVSIRDLPPPPPMDELPDASREDEPAVA